MAQHSMTTCTWVGKSREERVGLGDSGAALPEHGLWEGLLPSTRSRLLARRRKAALNCEAAGNWSEGKHAAGPRSATQEAGRRAMHGGVRHGL